MILATINHKTGGVWIIHRLFIFILYCFDVAAIIND